MILNFSFKIGSAFKNIFFSYHIDFINKVVIYDDKKFKLSKENILFIKDKIKKSNCLNYEESYVNRLIKDGTQWNLNIKTLLKEKNVHGDNAYPDKFNHLIELNDYIKKILKEE